MLYTFDRALLLEQFDSASLWVLSKEVWVPVQERMAYSAQGGPCQ